MISEGRSQMGGDREYPSRPVRRPPGHSGAAATTVRGGAYPTMARMVAQGTRAIDAARRAGIVYAVHEYAHDPRSSLREGGRGYALEAVAALGLDPARVFKTIVVGGRREARSGRRSRRRGGGPESRRGCAGRPAVRDRGGRRGRAGDRLRPGRDQPAGDQASPADGRSTARLPRHPPCTSRPGVAASRSSCRRTTSRGSPARCWRRSRATAELSRRSRPVPSRATRRRGPRSARPRPRRSRCRAPACGRRHHRRPRPRSTPPRRMPPRTGTT